MFQVCLLLLIFWPQQEEPLPDQASFMSEFRKTLHEDNTLLRQYTYTAKETEITVDSKGKPKKTETNVYHVFHGAEDWQTYRRHISKNDVSLTEKESEKFDREERERIAKETRKRAAWSEQKRRQEKEKVDREEREVIDEAFSLFDVQFVRREMLDGLSTILVTFKPKPNYKPKTSDGKAMQHFAGRAWIAEEDHELAKLEIEAIQALSIGAGLLAKIDKGSTLAFERRKINGEIWMPLKEEVSVNGRLLLLKGLNLRLLNEYSEFKKYTVDTILNFDEVRR